MLKETRADLHERFASWVRADSGRPPVSTRRSSAITSSRPTPHRDDLGPPTDLASSWPGGRHTALEGGAPSAGARRHAGGRQPARARRRAGAEEAPAARRPVAEVGHRARRDRRGGAGGRSAQRAHQRGAPRTPVPELPRQERESSRCSTSTEAAPASHRAPAQPTTLRSHGTVEVSRSHASILELAADGSCSMMAAPTTAPSSTASVLPTANAGGRRHPPVRRHPGPLPGSARERRPHPEMGGPTLHDRHRDRAACRGFPLGDPEAGADCAVRP